MNWQPIETAPMTDTTILVALESGHVTPAFFQDGFLRSLTTQRRFFDRATHWMPLPEPPEVAP